jgi:L-alanine-DL-glutamate epimerase-like enolase superfamily enzyme
LTLKIVRIVAVPIGIPLKKPLLMAGRRYAHAETVLVRVETTGRFLGHGEAPVAPFLTGETIPSVLASVEILAQAIVGRDARDLIALSQVLHGAIVGNAAAKAAVEVALHDAVAREYGISVYRLLGGRTQLEFGCLTLVGNNDRERDLADVMARAASGFSAFKLKVANGDLKEEASTLIEMRKRLGPKALLCADANGGWTAEDAIRFVRLAEASSADFLEQPVPPGNHDGMVRVARASAIPICADESIHEIADIRRLLESEAVAGVAFKIMKLEGIRQCNAGIQLCRALGGHVNLSGKFGETSVANAATLALATAAGGVDWGLSITNDYLAEDIVREPIVVANGKVRLPEGPGLGIDIDEAKLSRLELHSSAATPPLNAQPLAGQRKRQQGRSPNPTAFPSIGE